VRPHIPREVDLGLMATNRSPPPPSPPPLSFPLAPLSLISFCFPFLHRWWRQTWVCDSHVGLAVVVWWWWQPPLQMGARHGGARRIYGGCKIYGLGGIHDGRRDLSLPKRGSSLLAALEPWCGSGCGGLEPLLEQRHDG
jgi:hypothetical protein